MRSPISGTSGNLRWQAVPEWTPLLFGLRGLRLDEWQERGWVDVVKHGPHRTVYRVRLPDGTVFVKHRRPNRLADVARHLVRASPARREWGKALELGRRGVPTVKPVAWQERVRGGLVWDSFLVTEAIEPACSLEEFFLRRLPELPDQMQPATRRHVIRSLAQFTAAIHRSGVVHHDFHAGNILLGQEPEEKTEPWPMHLIDVPDVRFLNRGPLGWAASLPSIIMLNAGWWERASRSERLRFWETYLGERPELRIPERRAALAQIDQGTRQYARKIARRRDRRALGTNRHFTAAASRGREAHAVAELAGPELARLIHDPESLLWQNLARPVKLGRSIMAVEAELLVGDRAVQVLYKRYRPRNWWKALVARFRQGRALDGWRGGHALLLRRVPTARPVAVCQVRSGRARGYGYLATEWIEGAENLHLFGWRLAGLPTAERFARAAACAQSLGAVVGRMHAWGIAHGDLKASNLLVADSEPAPRVYVVDADDVKVRRRLGRRRQSRDLARLATSIQAHPWVSRTLVSRFFRAYRRQFPPGEVDWKRLWRSAFERSRQESLRKQKRGEPVL